MKKIVAVSLAFIISLTNMTVSFAGNNDIKQWDCYKEIKLNGNNKYKVATLDDEVYRYAKADLSDLRLVDEKGQFVPYYIENQKVYSNIQQTSYSSKIVDSYKKDNNTITDFNVIPKEQSADILAEQLKFTVNSLSGDSKDYLKNVEVYGSHDGVNWEFIKNDKIYSVQNTEKNTIELSKTLKFNYYRIKAINDLDNLKLSGMEAIYNNIYYVKENFEKKATLKYNIKSDSTKTYIEIDNVNKINVNGIKLNIEGNFKRDYQVNVIDQNSVSTTITTGYLYNLNFKDVNISNTYIENIQTSSAKIQVVIFNYDDNPLKIKNIDFNYAVDKIVFDGSQSKLYKLYFGNQNAQRPQYDIEGYRSYIENENKDECTLEKLIGKSQEAPRDYKNIFNIVIVLVSLSLAAIIFTKVKNNAGKDK